MTGEARNQAASAAARSSRPACNTPHIDESQAQESRKPTESKSQNVAE